VIFRERFRTRKEWRTPFACFALRALRETTKSSRKVR
jgi:hypothetical protein